MYTENVQNAKIQKKHITGVDFFLYLCDLSFE